MNSDEKSAIFKTILEKIAGRKENKPYIIGITGIDASGKTFFAKELASFLMDNQLKIQLLNLDDFHNPRKVRYSGQDQAKNYYERSFDLKTIVDKLLQPVSQQGSIHCQLQLLDLDTDEYTAVKEFIIDRDTFVIFEGVFLFREEFAKYIDFKIFLEITFEECLKRAKTRDSSAIMEKYSSKYIPAQKEYLKNYPPGRTADLVIDNSDWESPIVVSG